MASASTPIALPVTTRDPRPGLSGLTPGELEAWLVARGQPAYRAKQIGDGIWRTGAWSLDEVLTLPSALRSEAILALPPISVQGECERGRLGSCCVGKQLKHLALCCFARLDFLETAFFTFPQEGSRQPTTYLSEPSLYFLGFSIQAIAPPPAGPSVVRGGSRLHSCSTEPREDAASASTRTR